MNCTEVKLHECRNDITLTASDQLQRYDAIRRKNAESAYNRNVQYNGQNQKTVENLEALLIGKERT